MLPKFPVKISFDIANAKDTSEMWNHPQARTLCLLWRPNHLTNQYFWSECLRLGRVIEKLQPKTVKDLFHCLAYRCDNFPVDDVEEFCKDALPYFTGKEVPFVITMKE